MIMQKLPIDASWKAWLDHNLDRGCDAEELFAILVQNHFSLESIREAMGDHDPTRAPLTGGRATSNSAPDFKAIAATRLTDPQKCPQARPFCSADIQLYTIDHFLSEEECDELSAVIRGSLHPSTIATAAAEPDKYFRTSKTCDLGTRQSSVVDSLDKKISRTIGICLPYSEAPQGHVYAVGEEFKAHTDYFEPGAETYVKHCAVRGNRTWTFMVYLNDVHRGGGTFFLRLGHTFQPCKGRALIWNNLDAEGRPNYNTVHAGQPVEEGEKVIVTKWFRERGTGPMFCSE